MLFMTQGLVRVVCSMCIIGHHAPGSIASFVRRFVLHVPENLPLNASAPLLCAGITTYSPLMHYGLNKPGQKLGVVGLGGLGHMAVKIAKAMGLEVIF